MVIRVPQQPLRLLSVLVESPGEIVTRDVLRQRLWPSDVFIDFDHGLNKSIQKLRDALGDSADSPRYIETIPRVGYRFIAPTSSGARSLPNPVVQEIKESPLVERALLAAASEAPIAPGPFVTGPIASGSIATGPFRPKKSRWLLPAIGVSLVCVALAISAYLATRARPAVTTYTPLTDFTDSVTTPALSPDGHMLAFIRGDGTFVSTGQIYVKLLPDGDARALNNDTQPKYNLAFSPDGSQIAYTAMEPSQFSTYAVSALGGDPHLLLRNAAGLTWLDPQHYLFSRMRSGLHMGIVTQSLSQDSYRELYYPPHERAMAHYSFASPDRQSALVVEMDGQGDWSVCQLIALTGSTPARAVGPKGACTAAAWSRDGSWMYFVVTIDSQSHVWRQQYPDGRPEQITVGPSEEAGLAVEPDGRSLITSIGQHQSAIWFHDATGERSLSSEGEVMADISPPTFGADGTTLYYLLRHRGDAYPTLWRLMLGTGKSEALFPGSSMGSYDVSPDGKQVVYTNVGSDGETHLWLAPIDRSSAARQIGPPGVTNPHFGSRGEILFRFSEGNVNYFEQINQDGSGRSKVIPNPILEVLNVSPQRKWLTAVVASSQENGAVPLLLAIPLDGGPARRLCAGYCVPVWSPNSKFLFIPVESSPQSTTGRSLALPIGPGETLPVLPAGGIPSSAGPGVVHGAQSIDRDELIPGNDPQHYAYVNTTVHRNLYRISLP